MPRGDRRHRWVAVRWVLAAACVSGLGCSSRPSFPKDSLAASLQAMFDLEQLQSSVRLLDHTLAVHVDYPGALKQENGQISIGPNFDEATRKTLTGMHRVILSTDADIQFYVLLISDHEAPGAYLTMVRYIDDIKRANANMIDTPEMFARTIFELNFVGNDDPLKLEQYVPRDVELGEFLTWQLSRRIQARLTQDLEPSGIASVGRCGGEFKEGEFAFTLDVNPAGDTRMLDEETVNRVFQASTQEIAQVLASYRFSSFDGIRLVHQATGRHLVLPKTRLEIFR